ncbi:MAG: hypothetical protein COU08_03700 [Candidatus Harrisonbacteria bacterium CG10_big_fil_rev_8_21_14_0_10_42_17]|uniref:Uncharacterized protein n=1 Tax=Candidatus Harrisonbacteria bacterium CG10_big_fil_rev_8_21_14_0_10_42_17 TaxID=1974584 RepID=A0A2M6WH91_9BACT|nr:MAG: hypothetical protein COU08_03700 [Candidatus Harrisonbacteria bacterium CG10_big_fil_rev_8_21_14_0_10_42_17]
MIEEKGESLNSVLIVGSVITAIATVFLAIFAAVGISQTNAILKQQRKAEVLENRAYLSIEQTTLVSTEPYAISFQIINSGKTPARVEVREIYFIDSYGQKQVLATKSAPGAGQTIINPLQQEIFRAPLTGEEELILKSKGSLVITIIYEIYNRERYVFTNRQGFILDEEGSTFFLFEEYEKQSS